MFDGIRVSAYGSKAAVFVEGTQLWRETFGDERFTRVFERLGRFDEFRDALTLAWRQGIPSDTFGLVCYAALMQNKPIAVVFVETIDAVQNVART